MIKNILIVYDQFHRGRKTGHSPGETQNRTQVSARLSLSATGEEATGCKSQIDLRSGRPLIIVLLKRKKLSRDTHTRAHF